MRYVGRHRSPRPLLLRRPIIGGVAVAVILIVPATLAATGKSPIGPGSSKVSDNTGSKPIGAATGTTAPAVTDTDTLVPTDGTAVDTSVARQPPANPASTTGGGGGIVLPVQTTTTGSRSGGGGGGYTTPAKPPKTSPPTTKPKPPKPPTTTPKAPPTKPPPTTPIVVPTTVPPTTSPTADPPN